MDYKNIDFNNGIKLKSSSFITPESEVGEHHLFFSLANDSNDLPGKLKELSDIIRVLISNNNFGKNLQLVFTRWFLSDAANQENYIKGIFPDCAVSMIEQPPCDYTRIALWIYAVNNLVPTRDGNMRFVLEHNGYQHLWQGDRDLNDLDSLESTEKYLSDYSSWLISRNCTLEENCLRTWFFVKDIDLNYKGLVDGRNKIFDLEGLTADNHFIASTGIGGRKSSPYQTISFNAYALRGARKEQIRYLKGKTHLNSTSEYGVAFERGVAIDYGDRRHVLISGTASINNKGEIMYAGNIILQSLRMLENIEVLLKEAETDWEDVMMAIIYLRDFSDYKTVKNIIKKRFPALPLKIVMAAVCRPSWLVEMECMAVKSCINSQYLSY